jgi:hypothetical protein
VFGSAVDLGADDAGGRQFRLQAFDVASAMNCSRSVRFSSSCCAISL